MLIDAFLPDYDFVETHGIVVAAAPATIEPLLRELDMSRSLLVRALLALRGIPGRSFDLAGLERMGFRLLAHRPGQEIVLGLIGRFWTTRGELQHFEPAAFVDFAEPGYAKGAWNFSLHPIARGRTVVRTETRVWCPDDDVRRRFGWYWRVIRPFSGLIREEILREVRRESERRSGLLAATPLRD